MKICGIIPARYESTRLPFKPLADINGLSMISRVYQQVIRANVLDFAIVATDSGEIASHLKKNDIPFILTSNNIKSGTDRCAEALNKLKTEWDYIINIQGDEPFIIPEHLRLLKALTKERNLQIGTLVKPFSTWANFQNSNRVKAIISKDHKALYFSRSPIPFYSDETSFKRDKYAFKHLGFYIYSAKVLKEISKLKSSKLENLERLEQLRWLDNGYSIEVAITDKESISIDTEADLIEARKFAVNFDKMPKGE